MKRNAMDAAFIELMVEMKSGELEVSTIPHLKKKMVGPNSLVGPNFTCARSAGSKSRPSPDLVKIVVH
jgi:hypothetical protein